MDNFILTAYSVLDIGKSKLNETVSDDIHLDSAPIMFSFIFACSPLIFHFVTEFWCTKDIGTSALV